MLREAWAKKRCLVPHLWIVEMLAMVKGLLRGNMSDWKTELMSNGEVLGELGTCVQDST